MRFRVPLFAAVLSATALALSLIAIVPDHVSALEKAAAPFDGENDAWSAGGASASISYYNICTGWIWVWSGWEDGDRLGLQVDSFGFGCYLLSHFTYFVSAAPSGYGFTGTAGVHTADSNDCPVGTLATQPFLPITGWNLLTWNVPTPGSFVLTYDFASAQGLPNPAAIATEHPAAGPTGPAACGTCYPTNRTNHSFYFGTGASPLCPGSPLNDGLCDAQFLWDVQMACPFPVDETSWGQIKGLYR